MKKKLTTIEWEYPQIRTVNEAVLQCRFRKQVELERKKN